MNKKIALLIMITLMVMPLSVTAQEGWTITSVDIHQMSIYNVMLHGIDYNDTAKILRISLTPKVNEWNVGLGLVILKFNVSTVPSHFSAYVMLPDNTTVPAVTLLKNFTIENGQYLRHDGWIHDAKFVKLYFYQFVNHTQGPETQFWTAFDAGWNDSAHASQWPNYDPNNSYWDKFNTTYPTTPPMALAEETIISEDFDYRIIVDAQFPDATDPTNTNEYPWILGLGIGLTAGVIVLVIVWMIKRR